MPDEATFRIVIQDGGGQGGGGGAGGPGGGAGGGGGGAFWGGWGPGGGATNPAASAFATAQAQTAAAQAAAGSPAAGAVAPPATMQGLMGILQATLQAVNALTAAVVTLTATMGGQAAPGKAAPAPKPPPATFADDFIKMMRLVQPGAGAITAGFAGAAGGPALGLAGAGAQMLGARLPVVGAILELLDTVTRAYTQQTVRNIAVLGSASAAAARSDVVGAQRAVLEKQVAEFARVPVLGGIWDAIRGKSVQLESLKVFDQMRDALGGQIRQVAPYSAQVSLAQAQAQITQIMANVREAERLGPIYAGYTRVQAQYQAAQQAALEPMRVQMADQLMKLMETGTASPKKIAEEIKKMESNSLLLESIKDGTDQAKKFQEDMIRELKRIRRQNEAAFGDDVLDAFESAFFRLPDKPNTPERRDPWVQQQQIKPLG